MNKLYTHYPDPLTKFRRCSWTCAFREDEVVEAKELVDFTQVPILQGLKLEDIEHMDKEPWRLPQGASDVKDNDNNGNRERGRSLSMSNSNFALNENSYFEQALDSFITDVLGQPEPKTSSDEWKRAASSTTSFTRNFNAQTDVDATLQKATRSSRSSQVEERQEKQEVSSQVNLKSKRSRKRRRASSSEGRNKQRSKKLSSLYRGVSKCSKDGRWQARIRIGAVVKYLGRFKSEIEAAHCYDAAAHRYHGERAMPNFNARGERNLPQNDASSVSSSDSETGAKTE